MQPKDTTLAYLAGMIDGDGYVSIVRSVRNGVEYFAPQVGISGTLRAPHDLASSIWGGKVSCHLPKNPNHRPQFQWSRQGSVALQIIEALYPYLLLKQEHALLAMELHEHVRESRQDDPFPWFGPDYDPLCTMRRMRDDMIEMNQSRNRIGKKAAGRLLDGRTHDEFPRWVVKA
ncbi:hypothetical protein [Paraburkholderia hospita]|uniref:hypothetical protein n=1 Tax=Paraburkholderia hospita TaxID=169430 RepID=UPI003ECD48C1